MKLLLTLLILVGCAKTPQELSEENRIPDHTIHAFRYWCEDKDGPSTLVRTSGEGNFRGTCRDGSFANFSHGDILFGPKEEHEEE